MCLLCETQPPSPLCAGNCEAVPLLTLYSGQSRAILNGTSMYIKSRYFTYFSSVHSVPLCASLSVGLSKSIPQFDMVAPCADALALPVSLGLHLAFSAQGQRSISSPCAKRSPRSHLRLYLKRLQRCVSVAVLLSMILFSPAAPWRYPSPFPDLPAWGSSCT